MGDIIEFPKKKRVWTSNGNEELEKQIETRLPDGVDHVHINMSGNESVSEETAEQLRKAVVWAMTTEDQVEAVRAGTTDVATMGCPFCAGTVITKRVNERYVESKCDTCGEHSTSFAPINFKLRPVDPPPTP